ncbi:cysteine desulfurase family protein [Chrysiogenes arsenatis]|uniref:cysteine desulfurase family protein n=1 Tax=Chrysiogenes arsenatis TaxID=309797 RepID=UPI000421AF94|nr:cysteine desulfurase family protein [Chrysiogenes arsenatis]
MSHYLYFDLLATTPCDERVVAAMLPYFTEQYGNPASTVHRAGKRALNAVHHAREQVAALIGAHHSEIIFTAGATESNNLALLGIAPDVRQPNGRRKILTSSIEHRAVLAPCRSLKHRGFCVIELPVASTGRLNMDALEEAIDSDTLLISVQLANNEIGTIQDIAAICALAREYGAAVHCDAAQGVGKIPVQVAELGIDFLSISAHKFYGPKGIGALYCRHDSPFRLVPMLHGGTHEHGLRPGTLNVPAIVGFGEACAIAQQELAHDMAHAAALRQLFIDLICHAIPESRINGDSHFHLPGCISITLPEVDAESIMLATPDIAMSSGAACTSDIPEQSHVLSAIGLPPEAAAGTLRLAFGRGIREEDVRAGVALLTEAYFQTLELS